MKTLLLDDEPFALSYLEKLCLQVPNMEIAAVCDNAIEALDYVSAHNLDLVITDIEMPGLTGIEAVKQLRGIKPDIGVIFVTGYEEYALQAYQMEAVAYIMKPCTLEMLKNAVKRAGLLQVPEKRVCIRTFGYFTVLIDGIPVRFANGKAKELAALLVDRNGGIVTIEQAVDILWENRFYDDTVKRLYRKAVSYLHQVFDGTDFFVSERGSCHIIPSKSDCDYFNFLENPIKLSETYHEEYMLDYSWSESTNGKIYQITHKNLKNL